MTLAVATVVLLLITLVYVAWPLVSGHPAAASSTGDTETDRLHSRIVGLETEKNLIYAQIKDLEFENATAKIDDEEFQRAREEYKRQAVPLVQEIDYLKNLDVHLEREIEQELDRVLAGEGSASPGTEPVEEAIAAREGKCPACGATVPVANRFCGQCGKPVN